MASDHDQGTGLRGKAYAGYYNRPATSDDSFLTQVGPGTPAGEYLRRYWQPFMLSSELRDLPVAVRLLSEDLVIFRDKGGRLGLLHKPCIHRGVSLEFGIIAERGIRCCYHGWHFDIDGTVLETPAEPPGSKIRQNFCQGAYPVREAQGMIFAYMGPPEALPEFPVFDTYTHPAGNRLANFKMFYPCNWLQVVENAADPIHNAYLHAIVSGTQFSTAFKAPPALDFIETPLGFLSMATRRVKDFVFVRASDIILPNIGQFAGGANPVTEESFFIAAFTTRWVVPIDDRNCLYIGVRHINTHNVTARRRGLDESMFGVGRMGLIGQTGDRPYEERQREPGDYDAITGQGVIANRRGEHLATTDRGVVLLRRLLARAVKSVQEGELPTVPRRYNNGMPVRTYCHELVLRLPARSKLGDLKSLETFGRREAGIVINTDGIPAEDREAMAASRIRRLVGTSW
jgi:nitrite reductase/ring-hydroxylating ferredoxin subunit